MGTLKDYENNYRVRLTDKLAKTSETYRIHKSLEPLLDKLLMEKPLWEFVISNIGFNNEVRSFTVHQDGEQLGSVSWSYYAGDNKYVVQNPRIDRDLVRRSAYSTKSMDKALAKIRKTFSAMSIVERMEAAQGDALSGLNSLRSSKYQEYSRMHRLVTSASVTYTEGTGKEGFLEYLKLTDMTMYNTVMETTKAFEEHQHVHSLSKAVGNDEAAIVLQTGSMYTVKKGDKIVRYTNDELPEHYRRKIGMLKLVEPNNMVTDMGYKATENTFVIYEEKEDASN